MPEPTAYVDPAPLVYPESDGKPMADNTKQFRWIYVIFANLAALFMEEKEIFVGGNLFWYPVEGEPDTKQAPDVFVVFGRPKGDRRSYRQWEENNVPMTVVFEIQSPGNNHWEMEETRLFYEEHGVEEYYLYDPELNRLAIYIRKGEVLRHVHRVEDYVSRRLGIRFDLSSSDLVVYWPDGERFLTFEGLMALHKQAESRAEQAETRAVQAEKRAARLAELGRKARQGLATPAELQELELLEDQSSSTKPDARA
jgi:Uma2 family endonuclease